MIVVCWKWVSAPRSASEQPSAVAVDGDARWAGVSDADRAALEIGLRLADESAEEVTVVTVGDAAAEHGLRVAIAAGAHRAVRIDGPQGLASEATAAAIATIAADATWVVCGDASADRGTGSVPAFLAAELGAAQALGLVAVTPAVDGGPLRVVRRLDGGRREVLDVTPPAVLSVEGSVTRLRRASLPAELAALTATIEHVAGPAGPIEAVEGVQPYRPRARALAAPSGDALDRVRLLTDTAGDATAAHAEVVTMEPADAADHILEALAGWGYLQP